MEKIILEAEKREELGKRVSKLRKQGLIPAIVYGRKISPLPIAIDKKTFIKNVLSTEAGMNAIVALKVKGESKKELSVLTHQVERDPLSGEILHVDFRHIVMDEAIRTKVPIELVGVAEGVKDGGGVLVHGLREVEVECLPADIPDKFEVDVSSLKIGDSLHVSDIPMVAKVKILSNPTEMIANCSPPTKEEVVAPAVPTPEEAAAAEAQPALAAEEVKEKAPPGAPPPRAKPSAEEKK